MDEKSYKTKQVTTSEDVVGFYDAYAKDWDRRFGQSVSLEYFLTLRLQSMIAMVGDRNVGHALELGAGTGVHLDVLSRKFGHITCVDGSSNMVGEIRDRCARSGLDNVEALISDVCRLEALEDASYDLVYFFGLIEHLLDPGEFFNEINRVVRDDGVVIGVMPNARCLWYSLRPWIRGTGMHCSSDTYYTIEQVEDLAREAGFKLVRHHYWGGVPADLRSRWMFRLLRWGERMIGMTPLRFLLGGATFMLAKVK